MKFQEMYGERERVSLTVKGNGAKQSFRDECDINTIMRRYTATGELPASARVGSYGDFVGPTDLMDAYEMVKRAEEQFAALPSAVRERFKNKPAAFLAFVQERGNQAEAKKLGLLEKEPPPSAELVELKRIADAAAAAVVAPKPPAA